MTMNVNREEGRAFVMRHLKMRRAHERFTAVVGALLLLSAQLLGAVHSHRYEIGTNLSPVGQATASESGPCPICVSTLHFPLVVAARPAVERRREVVDSAAPETRVALSVPTLDAPHGRAPPASV